jgi:hypothetical protein
MQSADVFPNPGSAWAIVLFLLSNGGMIVCWIVDGYWKPNSE